MEEAVPLLSPISAARRKPAAPTESLNYDPPTNKVRLAQRKDKSRQENRRHVFGYSGHTAVARVSTIVCGVLIGLTAVTLQSSIERLVLWRNSLLQRLFLAEGGPGRALGAWAGISAAAVLGAGTLVQLFAPKAAGAGVTLVMAHLNGNDIRGLLSMPVFVIKYVGLIASRVAGLAVGPEGPMVHLGACMASAISFCEPWFLNRALESAARRDSGSSNNSAAGSGRSSSSVASNGKQAGGGKSRSVAFKNGDHRELVSAGAGAGIAAAFGAPIGGVLFSLEEAATHWSRKVGWRCFLCTTTAAFTLAQLHPRSQSGMLSFKADTPLTNQQWLIQMPFVLLVSSLGGLLGAAFNVIRRRLWAVRASRKRTLLRLAEAAGVALVTVCVMAGLALSLGRCMPLPEVWADERAPMRLTCPAGQYNDLATAYMGSDVWVIRSLLNLGSVSLPLGEGCSLTTPCYFSWPSLVALSASYLLLMALASSLCVPGGLFMPSIMVGGSAGALFGVILREVLPSWDIQPGVYALICASAVLGGVFRSGLSLVVIVVEGTRGIDYLFGIIIAILISNVVAARVFKEGVYESELERDGTTYYLRPEPPYALRSKTADEMMATPVVGMEAIVPVAAVRQCLAATSHNGFPVYTAGYSRDPHTGMGRLEGFILRSQLAVLLRRGAYCNAAGDYITPPPDVGHYEAQLNLEMKEELATVVKEARGAAQLPPAKEASCSADVSRHGGQGNGGGERWGPPLRASFKFDSGGGGAASGGLGGGDGGRSSAHLSGFPWVSGSGSGESELEGLPPGDAPGPPPAGVPVGLTLEAAAAAAGLLGGTGQGLEGLEGAAAVAAAAAAASGEGLFLNLSPFMDQAPVAVRRSTLGTTVHQLFLSLSLRHLCVVDGGNRVLGIITRKDLDHAAGEGWWRINKIAPHPHHSHDWNKRQGSWLAMSLAAPRRLLSSIQAALSPITSPLGSRRGTPRGTPGGTPRKGTPRASPSDTPRTSDLEEGREGHQASPFWQSPSKWAEQLGGSSHAAGPGSLAVAAAAPATCMPTEGVSATAGGAAAAATAAGGAAQGGPRSGVAPVEALAKAVEAAQAAQGLPGGSVPAAPAALATPAAAGGPLGRPPALGRISPRRRGAVPQSLEGGESAGGALQSPFRTDSAPSLPPAGMATICENAEQLGPLGSGMLGPMDTIFESAAAEQLGPLGSGMVGAGEQGAVPRWARTVSRRKSEIQAFGSIAIAFPEEGEEEEQGLGGQGHGQEGNRPGDES